MVFRSPGYPPLLYTFKRPFGTEEDRDIGDLDFRATYPFQGKVLDPWNKPVRAAKVTLAAPWGEGRSQRTNRDGEFEFARLPEHPVPVVVEVRGMPPNRVTLAPRSQQVRQVIRIRTEGSLELEVVDRSKRAARGAVVRYLLAKEYDARRPRRRLPKHETDAKGRCTLTMPAGEYVVSATAGGGGLVGEARVTIRAGETLRREIQMESWYQRFLRQKKEEQEAKKKARWK